MQRFQSFLCGIAMMLLACPAWAGYVDNGDGTVTDKFTGLTWQQTGTVNGMTWKDALSYCESLKLGGHSDWRLPTIKELRSLVDYGHCDPAIDTKYFPDAVSSFYWSSSTCADATYGAWGVYFNHGYGNGNGKSSDGYVRAVRGGQSGSLGDSVISQTPMSGLPGTTFVEWGTGFTPNSTATLHFKKPDGTEYPTMRQPMDAIGHFEIKYTAPWDKPAGTYTWWAIDGVTGAKSNEVAYEITALAANLTVQTINPQSEDTLYNNFFPSPQADQLISGGATSNIIAADGESCLLLRLVSNKNPGTVTITESETNPSENGSLSDLDHYRDGGSASSVSVQLFQSGDQYFGFVVYRAPVDFNTFSGCANNLTRPVTLKADYAGGKLEIPLTLRRPPIFISHGLWSSPKEQNQKDFVNILWNRFTDNGDKNVDDYIRLNDCESENAKAFIYGEVKTQSNIRAFLDSIRKGGGTVTQVDYLGHSMGGIWGRLVEQNFKGVKTYRTGYLHKLITLDTPHVGSFLADLGQNLIKWSNINPLCIISKSGGHSLCEGAISDLASSGCRKNLSDVQVPAHAITSNIVTKGACDLLEINKIIAGSTATEIGSLYTSIEMMLRIANPDYGCENWVEKLGVPIQSDVIVGLDSQEGGLSGSQLKNLNTHWHMNSFDKDVGDHFFDLLNTGVNNAAFATGFPASSDLLSSQQLLALEALPPRLMSSAPQTSLGEIQFSSPVNGTTVQPGAQVNVALTLTGSLALNEAIIFAPGTEPIKFTSAPYTTVINVPTDAYDTYTIAALGAGTDGNLYSAYTTLSVNSTATLQKVDVSPQSIYMNLGQEMDISVTGSYSDGSIRNLSSAAQGTTYKSGDETMFSVSANGTVTPHTTGVGFALVTPAASNAVTVRVEIAAALSTSALSVTPTNRSVLSGSGTTTFSVSNTGTGTMPWTAAVTSGGNWLSISSGSSGSDAGAITCACNANTGAANRTGTIRVTATGATGSPVDVTVTQAGVSDLMAASFDGLGLWVYDSSSASWTLINSVNPESMMYSGSLLYADFGASYGLYQWDGKVWMQLASANPENMVSSGSTLYVDFGASGLWKWDGAAWSQLASAKSENMVLCGTALYVDFGSQGLWAWDASAWKQLTTANPVSMIAGGAMLYVNFGASYGLYQWNGAAWAQLTTAVPENMATSASIFYGDFGASGLWKWDAVWAQLASANPDNIATSASMLYVDFGAAYGLYQWDGAAWKQLATADPESMAVSGSALYGDFGSSGVWKWDGASWTQLTGANALKIAVSN